MKILLVESQSQVVLALKKILTELGHQVSVASTVERGLLRSKAFQFDALVVNGGVNGDEAFSFYKTLIKEYQNKAFPALFVFNSNAMVDPDLVKTKSPVEFIRLPFDETEFKIRWKTLFEPKVAAEVPLDLKEETKKNETSISGKVLLVEDNPINQRVLGMFITKMNLEYDTAADGQTAVDLCNKNEYAYVLMDIFMPGMDGIEATQLIRKNEIGKTHHAKIIAISANESDDSVKKCMEAGMDEYLVKPFTPESLKQKMQ